MKHGEVVRGLGMGDTVLDRWTSTQQQMVAKQTVTSERSAAVNAVSKFVGMLVQTMLLGAGAWLAIDQQISPGVMMASSIMMGRALAPVQMIVGSWKRIVALRAAYARIEQLFRAMPQVQDGIEMPAPTGKLDIEAIVVLPPTGGRPVVKGVSLSVEAGESVAVVGASGSGKSSLARAIAGVWPMIQGAVKLDGVDFSQWDPNKLGKHIGYLPQNVELFAGTIAQNIARLQDDRSDGGDRRRQGCRRARADPAPAQGLRHPDRRGRRGAVRRHAPARRPRPRALRRPAPDHPRRAQRQPRRGRRPGARQGAGRDEEGRSAP